MEQYTWSQFWIVVIIFAVIYYGVIYLVFYLPKKQKAEKTESKNNDSNNIDKSDNNITIFDSPFISNFDGEENAVQFRSANTPPEPVSETEPDNMEVMDNIEEEFEMVGFDEEDVIFDNGAQDDDYPMMEDTEDLVELDEDMFEVTWESYTPGEQINLDFDNNKEI